jgi:K+-sensing histidine kinase KdpD
MPNHIMSWQGLSEETIRAWSAIDLVHAVDHDLRGHVARVWSKGHALAQGGHGFTSDEQRHLLEQLRPHLDRMLDSAYRLTLWIDAQQAEPLQIVRPIQDVKQMLTWPPCDLLRHVDHDMQQSLPVVRQIVHDLATGHEGFTSADQKDRLQRLHRDVEKLQTVVEVIHVWLNTASSAP